MNRRRWIMVLLLLAGIALTLRLFPTVLSFVKANSDTLQGFDSLISLLRTSAEIALTLAVALFGIRLFTAHNLADRAADTQPLHAVTSNELRARLGRGGQVNWLNRLASQPADLQRHPRLIITGRVKLGKTREAIELIARAATDLVPGDRVFEPSPAFRLTNKEDLPAALRAQLPTSTPVLLFLDDLPWHFSGSALDQLATALTIIDECRSTYVIATARLEHLTGEHNAWLLHHGFHRINLPDLSQGETGRLIDNAAGIYNLQVGDDAQAAFIDNRDGTPERILATMRLLVQDERTEVDAKDVAHYSKQSLADLWAEIRRDVERHYPAVVYIFNSLAAFHVAHVSTYPSLVLWYAAHLWRDRIHSYSPLLPYAPLNHALDALAPFEIIVRDGQIHYPDIAVEGLADLGSAQAQIATFFERHRPRRFLRRTPNFSEHLFALQELGTTAINCKEWDRAAHIYTTLIEKIPHPQFYLLRGMVYLNKDNLAQAITDFNRILTLMSGYDTVYWRGNPFRSAVTAAYASRGAAYAKQGNRTQAIADLTRAIALDSQNATAYANRGITYAIQGDYDQAIADFTQAVALDPQVALNSQLAAAYANRGIAYAKQDDYDQAIADFTQAVALDPQIALNSQLAAVYACRGIAHAAQGDKDKAIADFTRVLEITTDPGQRQQIQDFLDTLTSNAKL